MTKRRPIRYDPLNDLYAILGVQPNASMDDLRRSFRLRAKEVHPDRNPDQSAWAHQQFQQLNEAYDILSNPLQREDYDDKRRRYRRSRDADGVAWWERPNPAGAPSMFEDRQGPLPRSASRTESRTTRAYGRRRTGTQPYHILFVVSSIMLAVSVCMWMNPLGTVIRGVSGPSILTDPAPTQQPDLITTPACIASAKFTMPEDGEVITEHLAVRGTASDPHFASYTVEVASPGAKADEDGTTTPAPVYFPLFTLTGSSPVENDALISDEAADTIMAAIGSGDYVLRLEVRLDTGQTLPACEVRFRRQRARNIVDSK